MVSYLGRRARPTHKKIDTTLIKWREIITDGIHVPGTCRDSMLGHHTGFIVSFDVILSILSVTLGRGSTGGMVREPRHRPLLLVSYHS